jgi:hypothetical protein
MSRRRTTLVLLIALVIAGCSTSETAALRAPFCGSDGTSTTLLMAQSTPGATLIPCIEPDALPATWTLQGMKIDSAHSQLAFIADMASETPKRLEVLLGDTCDVSEAVAVPSDERGAKRFERVDNLDVGYAGERYYVFDGGCVTYRFDARAEGWTAFVHDASLAVTFISRADVAQLADVPLDQL